MATVTFNPLVAVDFTTLNTVRASIDVTTATAYDFDTSDATDLDMEGTGFSYDASDNLTGGTLTRIDIDIAGNQPITNGGDINISGLSISATADLGIIDNGAFSLFGVALQGNDSFFLSGLSEDADTPTAINRIFGDDLRNLTGLVIGGGTNTNTGGNDIFFGGDNQLEVAGDAWDLDSSGFFALGSTYNGGNDTYSSVFTEELNRIAGDAWLLDRTGIGSMTLNGGNDFVDLGGNTSSSSFIAGDVNEMNNGVLNGGDDTLTGDDSSSPEVSGDVRTYDGGTVNGGDDVISLANFGQAGGDVMFLNAPVPAGVFTVTGGSDEITGGSGGDTIGGDVYDRNSTVDNLIVGGDDVIVGGAGNDLLAGEVAIGDAVIGVSGGNDVIFGGNGNDTVRGQTGDDLLDGGNGNDSIDGGTGEDTVSYATANAGVIVNLLSVVAQNTVGAGTDTIVAAENLTGSRYGDTLRGNNGSNAINGGLGADVLASGAGEDTLTGGAGNDTLFTGGQTLDVALGDGGDDTFEASGSGGNLLIGGAGSDTVSLASVGAASTINLALGTAQQNASPTLDLLFQIENATGGGGADDIIGSAAANLLSGGGGADEILGGGAGDTIDGGAGNDTLRGEAGNDSLSGGLNNDRMEGGDNNDTLNGGDNNDNLFGNANEDLLNGDAGNDTLTGGTGNDTLNGGIGTDRLVGEDGIDVLNGDDSNDTLDGGAQNDFLFGGSGADTYIGGSGADTFIFTPTAGAVQDVITVFEDVGAISDDLIDVTAYSFASVASITATAAGNDVILDFGGSDTVRLDDYLLTHALTDIGADDFLI